MQTRLWNLDKILLKNSDEHYLQTQFIIQKLGNLILSLQDYLTMINPQKI